MGRGRISALVVFATLAVPSTAAAAPHGAAYGGASSEAAPVSFQLDSGGRNISHFAIYWTAPCSDGQHVGSSTNTIAVPISSSGHVGPVQRSYQPDSNTKVDFTLEIALGSSKATGTFSATYTTNTSSGTVTCSSGSRSFTATRSNTFAGFSGAFPATYPAALRVGSHGRRVTSFLGAAQGSCSDGGPFSDTAVLTKKLKVNRRTGRFSGSFTRSGTSQAGNHFVATTKVTGKLKGGRASGTFRLHEVFTKPSGAPLATCDSSSVHFSAKHH